MRYMLILNTPDDGYDQYMKWPKEILEANGAFMEDFTNKLRSAGEFVAAEGLGSPQQARRVRMANGKPVTDGVFPESKEFLAGYWIIDVEDADRAFQLAAEASLAPGLPITGADGKPINELWIEVREIMGSRREIG